MTKSKSTILLILMFLFSAGFGAWGVVNLLAQTNQAARQAHAAASQAQNATKQIQIQRAESIYTSCTAQNTRHDRTVAELHIIIKKAVASATGQRKTIIKASEATTILLIDQLAPKQDCAYLAAAGTGKVKRHKQFSPRVFPLH